jgi:hypothetical protein
MKLINDAGLYQLIFYGKDAVDINLKNVAYFIKTCKSNGMTETDIRKQCHGTDIIEMLYIGVAFPMTIDNEDIINKCLFNAVLSVTMLDRYAKYHIIQVPFKKLIFSPSAVFYCEVLKNECMKHFYMHIGIELNLFYYQGVTAHILNATDEMVKYEIMCKCTNYDTMDREHLFHNCSINEKYATQNNTTPDIIKWSSKLSNWHMQKQYFLQDITKQSDQNQMTKIELPFQRLSKGLFITYPNVDDIVGITLLLNERIQYIQFNRFLIKMQCNIIDEQTLYLPFNLDKNYSNTVNTSFEGGISFCRFTKIELFLKLKMPLLSMSITITTNGPTFKFKQIQETHTHTINLEWSDWDW